MWLAPEEVGPSFVILLFIILVKNFFQLFLLKSFKLSSNSAGPAGRRRGNRITSGNQYKAQSLLSNMSKYLLRNVIYCRPVIITQSDVTVPTSLYINKH